MKYNTLSGSTVSADGEKSTFTIYADLDIADKNKDSAMESEVSKLKEELVEVQNALNKQTRRCRQLVEMFTRRLQEKEYQYENEKNLRDDQLARVLRALLLVDARLTQEQQLIANQLKEKDFIIQKQTNDLKKLMSNQFCKNCNQRYNSSFNLDSLDSSSEYMITDYPESNFGSMDSSSEMYAILSDKDSSSNRIHNLDDSDSNKTKSSDLNGESRYQKSRKRHLLERKIKKTPHRDSVGTYFEVLKLRSDNVSPYSNEDNTSNDYDNFDSLPSEVSNDQTSAVSHDIEISNEPFENNDKVPNIDQELEATNNLSLCESNITVIHNKQGNLKESKDVNENQKEKSENSYTENKLSDSIQVFEVDGETNDKWYISASDQEDEQQKSFYRNNPVLECVNQILLQNINDSLNSPPKTPNVERKTIKNKRVKFSDEKIHINEDQVLTEENLKENDRDNHDYYETPIQKVPHFYEIPQSTYSNDYEQIRSRCSETFSSPSNSIIGDNNDKQMIKQNINNIMRKNKILRTPPALPPKPANLGSKYKNQNNTLTLLSDKSSDIISLSSEPDYCSISELNLPTDRVSSKKTPLTTEVNTSNSSDTTKNIENSNDKPTNNPESNHYDSVNVETNDMVMKTIEKVNVRIAKQTTICSEDLNSSLKFSSKLCREIPKLPLVSEIIIPEEKDKENEEIITQDNYVKNNSQILKTRTVAQNRKPINIGTSVSSLIMGFNNRELMYELNEKSIKTTPPKKITSSFENAQNIGKQLNPKTQTLDDFNLNQNFEEFKLDDCEIEEYNVDMSDSEEKEIAEQKETKDRNVDKSRKSDELKKNVDDICVPNLNRKSLELLKQQLEKREKETKQMAVLDGTLNRNSKSTYENFLECTGLSSKSILTSPRVMMNHNSFMKDIKLKSQAKKNYLDSSNSSSIKFWSESFI